MLKYQEILEAEGMPEELLSLFNEDVTQFPDECSNELERAGVDFNTDVATFIEMNGRNVFVVGTDEAEERELDCFS